MRSSVRVPGRFWGAQAVGGLILALVLAVTACGQDEPAARGGSSLPVQSSPTVSPTRQSSGAIPRRIVGLTQSGDIVVIDRASMRRVETIVSFPPHEDPETTAGSFEAVDVVALPEGRVLLVTCCEPAGGLIYVLDEKGRRVGELSGWDAQPDPTGDRLAVGEIYALTIMELRALDRGPSATIELTPSQQGFAPEDLSWSPDGRHVLFTIGGRLGLVEATATSLADATYVDPPEGTHWTASAYTVEGPVAVVQPGDLFEPSGPSRLVRIDLDAGATVEVVAGRGRITDLTVDTSGRHLLWVEDGQLVWRIDRETSTLPGEFVAAAWVPRLA